MKVAIYGAGGNGVQFYEAISESGIEVEFLIDEYIEKSEHRGRPIFRISQVPDKTIPVYVSVACYSSKIAVSLRENGFREVYDFNQSVVRFPQLIAQYFERMPWYSRQAERLVNENEIEKLRNLLSDDISLDVLNNIVKFRQTPSADNYIKNDGQLQYFPDDVPIFADPSLPLRMVDCGAFTGDTLVVALNFLKNKKLPIHAFSLFEPDKKNLNKLEENVKKNTSEYYDIQVFPCGVWSENAILEFSSNSSSSRILDSAQLNQTAGCGASNIERIHAVSIDQVLYGSRPNYIKMDIEGAENSALLGAEKIIRDYHPRLAICLYQKAEHLWELPFLIHSFYPHYAYYLRVHGDMGLETVIYCLPKSKV